MLAFLGGITTEIKNEIDNIPNILINIRTLEDRIKSQIDNSLQSNNYISLLGLCNLKNEILSGLGNKLLDNEYAKKAYLALKRNKDIQQEIIMNFLPEIITDSTETCH